MDASPWRAHHPYESLIAPLQAGDELCRVFDLSQLDEAAYGLLLVLLFESLSHSLPV